ncbi:MAG TPA: hypothetical protein VNS63_04395 [Blastocatellia bacterium]|nr:hypothetical protein [Blastocatellia bacterium]
MLDEYRRRYTNFNAACLSEYYLFGTRWWTSRRAGDYLKQMWETGDRHTADEMAAQIGVGPISFELLIDEFNRALKN